MASGGGSRLKMAVTGFAGTGKTTLCEALGEHFALPVLGEDMGAITAANQEAERVLRFAYSTAAERSAAREASIEAYVAWLESARGPLTRTPASSPIAGSWTSSTGGWSISGWARTMSIMSPAACCLTCGRSRHGSITWC